MSGESSGFTFTCSIDVNKLNCFSRSSILTQGRTSRVSTLGMILTSGFLTGTEMGASGSLLAKSRDMMIEIFNDSEYSFQKLINQFDSTHVIPFVLFTITAFQDTG